jgi:erythromycin esterase
MHAAEPDNIWEYSPRRDRALADNIGWLLDQAGPEVKLTLWAHNSHVNNRAGWMGSHLRQAYGRQMIIVGFTFYQGTFRALAGDPAPDTVAGVHVYRAGPAPSDSYEAFFHAAAQPRLIVDLRTIPRGSPAESWLAGSRPFRRIGFQSTHNADLRPASATTSSRLRSASSRGCGWRALWRLTV